MIPLDPMQLLAIPAVTGIVQAIKVAGMNKKYSPIIAIAVGIGVSLLFGVTAMNALLGVLFGLAGVGMYEFPKLAGSPPDPVPTITYTPVAIPIPPNTGQTTVTVNQ